VGTAVDLSSSALPAVVGQDVQYVADVAPVGANGSVGFMDDDAGIPGCGAVPVESGQAVCTVQYQSAGSHAISAVFAPTSSGVLGSHSATLGQTVTESSSESDEDGEGGSGSACDDTSSNPDAQCDQSQAAAQGHAARSPADDGGDDQSGPVPAHGHDDGQGRGDTHEEDGDS
jgi:hypothetical protein